MRPLLLAGITVGSCLLGLAAHAQTVADVVGPTAVSELPSIAARPIEVPTRTSIPPHEEETLATTPRSSADYEAAARAASAGPPAPWNAKPWDAPPGGRAASLAPPLPWVAATPVDTTAVAGPTLAGLPSMTVQGFIGDTAPLPCRPAPYRVLIDTRAALSYAKLCLLPDGSWLLTP